MKPAEKPMPFQDWGVRAILDGTKTQTRRVVPRVPAVPHPVGSFIWVKETWMEHLGSVLYRADDPAGHIEGKWRPSIFMARCDSRILLEVTDVRVQRVQEISEEDACAEGIFELLDQEEFEATVNDVPRGQWKACYRRVWDAINAKRGLGWEANPFVFAYTFRRVKS